MTRTPNFMDWWIPMLTVAIVGCTKEADRPPRSTTETANKKSPQIVTPAETVDLKMISVTSDQLCSDYNTDSVAADQKYKGKLLRLEGLVSNISYKQTKGKPDFVVYLQGGTGRIREATCYLTPASMEKAKDLLKGQSIRIEGKCIGDCKLEHCMITETGPSIIITAAKLTQEYSKDDKAANAKYENRPLVIDGVVAYLDPSQYKVTLEGFDEKAKEPWRVEVEMDRTDFPSIKNGQQLTIRGQGHGSFRTIVMVTRGKLMK